MKPKDEKEMKYRPFALLGQVNVDAAETNVEYCCNMGEEIAILIGHLSSASKQHPLSIAGATLAVLLKVSEEEKSLDQYEQMIFQMAEMVAVKKSYSRH
jgi:hypothetical protein